MIYSIGLKNYYEQRFLEFKDNPCDFKKMGKTDDYIGGSVFQTKELAEKFLIENVIEDFGIYGVLADWDKDTEESNCHWWNNLLIDAQLIRIEEEK
ncbi:hypothetical protein D3C81_958480 [compost metagenome]